MCFVHSIFVILILVCTFCTGCFAQDADCASNVSTVLSMRTSLQSTGQYQQAVCSSQVILRNSSIDEREALFVVLCELSPRVRNFFESGTLGAYSSVAYMHYLNKNWVDDDVLSGRIERYHLFSLTQRALNHTERLGAVDARRDGEISPTSCSVYGGSNCRPILQCMIAALCAVYNIKISESDVLFKVRNDDYIKQRVEKLCAQLRVDGACFPHDTTLGDDGAGFAYGTTLGDDGAGFAYGTTLRVDGAGFPHDTTNLGQGAQQPLLAYKNDGTAGWALPASHKKGICSSFLRMLCCCCFLD